MIESWLTTPAGVYIAHLDRSQDSPFRRFAVSRMRGADPGVGSLEYHRNNQLLRDNPGLFADGNLVWMRYRGRTLTWIVEERKAVLDDSENATDWIAVSGRGVKQLLADRTVWPTAFSESSLDPSAWGPDAQWYRVVNRAAGEMLWDMIAASNARFATPLVRGTIEAEAGWTQDFRFDGLLDVVASVCASYGDVDMDGRTFSYRNAPGVNRSASVIFEEGADLLKVERQTSDRDTLSWIVAEGVGEGVIAKLATATDATIARRREGYLDAKDAGNLPLVQLRANAVLDENKPVDSIALEVTEGRFAAFTDFDLWDTVRVIAPSRGIDELGIVVALYLVEGDDERVRVGIDVNSPRQEYLIRLAEGNRSTANSVGVRNRMPQGQLVPFSFSGADIFDDSDTMDVFFLVPSRMYVLIECRAMIRFRQFFASAKSVAAASSGTLTSASSGTLTSASSGTLTSASGGGSTSGASSAGSSDADSHTHEVGFTTGSTGGKTLRQFSALEGEFDLATNFSGMWHTGSDGAGGHSHGIPHVHGTPNHQHTVPGHDHTVAGHDHTVAGHTHTLTVTYGVIKETYPGSHSVTLKVYELVSSTWTLRSTIAALTADIEDVDLTQWVTGPGAWRLEIKSDAGQPNGGRLGCDVAGYALGAIQSS